MKLKLVAFLLLTLPGVVHAGGASKAPRLPKTVGYSFYVQGVPVGRADVKITQTAGALTFESNTHVLVGPDVVALTTKTIADPKTYVIRDFSYKGMKGTHPVACAATVQGDSVFGFVEMDGIITDKRAKTRYPHTLLFEDWVMEHEILLALTQLASPTKTTNYGLVFTSSLTANEMMAGFSGDVLVEAGPKSMTARKLLVHIQGAQPFESHVDPARGIPVYIRFHAAQAEAFLDEVFGENPVTYFSPKEKKD